jgi:hypothetical protein
MVAAVRLADRGHHGYSLHLMLMTDRSGFSLKSIRRLMNFEVFARRCWVRFHNGISAWSSPIAIFSASW